MLHGITGVKMRTGLGRKFPRSFAAHGGRPVLGKEKRRKAWGGGARRRKKEEKEMEKKEEKKRRLVRMIA